MDARPRRAGETVALLGALLGLALGAVGAAGCSATGGAPDAAVDSGSPSGADGGVASDASVPDGGASGKDGGLDAGAPWTAGLERCGNGLDDDGDGLVDEDCPPSFFVGLFPPNGGDDLATPSASHVVQLEANLGRKLSVIQTYCGTQAFDTVKVGGELAAIWAHGAVAHLYLEPDGYTPAQVADAANDPAIDADLRATAAALADALAAHPQGRLLLSFGAEMNGTWTSWGCANLSAATFVAWSRKVHDLTAAALASSGVDGRRVRWVYAPNSVSSGGCGSPAAYYPGHAYVDYLGMSAYRQGTASVESTVMTPSKQLMGDLGYPSPWQRDRFIVLQTGSRTIAGDDRGAWLSALVTDLAADPAYLGVIPFDLSDSTRDWALLADGMPPTGRSGYPAFVAAARAVPAPDGALEGTFEPYFWDVHVEDDAYPEIQALRGARITSGCSAAPPLFCPDEAIERGAAATLMAGATGASLASAEAAIVETCRSSGGDAGIAPCPNDPIRRDSLATALATLVSATHPGAEADLDRLAAEATVEPARDASRAEAAVWIVHTARVAPATRP